MTPCDEDGNLINSDDSVSDCISGEEGGGFAARAFEDLVLEKVSAISCGVAGEGVAENDFVFVHYIR
jgi:hypothetical protein